MNSPHVVYTPRPDATPETELSALTAVYRYVLFDSQAKRGDPHDLTNDPPSEMTNNGPRKTEQENT